jgi:hypothetical protein
MKEESKESLHTLFYWIVFLMIGYGLGYAKLNSVIWAALSFALIFIAFILIQDRRNQNGN